MIELLLLTAIPAMIVAQRGLPPVRVLAVTLTAGALAAASASTMSSCLGYGASADGWPGTRARSSRAGALPAVQRFEMLVGGVALGAGATVLLGLLANWLSATLADAAIVLFTVIWAMRLRRGSPPGNIAGGAAACFPVFIAWSAVTGSLSLRVIVMVIVIFCWLPPRLWSLAMEFRGGYPAALAGTSAAAASAASAIVWYSCVMVAVTCGLAPYGGWIYTLCALALGGWFLAEARRLRVRTGRISGSVRATVSARVGSPMRLSGFCLACLAQFCAVTMALVLLPRSR